jgi:Tol biopolymer transport system component
VILDQENARALVPVGWSRGSLLFLMVSSTDTSLYAIVSGHRHFVNIVIPQSVTSALLSPDGKYIAFGVPTNCGYCTLDLYDLQQATISNGPSGMPNEMAMTWTHDGSQLVAQVQDRLALITPSPLSTAVMAAPADLPDLSVHAMSASTSGRALTMVDLATGRAYRSTW